LSCEGAPLLPYIERTCFAYNMHARYSHVTLKLTYVMYKYRIWSRSLINVHTVIHATLTFFDIRSHTHARALYSLPVRRLYVRLTLLIGISYVCKGKLTFKHSKAVRISTVLKIPHALHMFLLYTIMWLHLKVNDKPVFLLRRSRR